MAKSSGEGCTLPDDRAFKQTFNRGTWGRYNLYVRNVITLHIQEGIYTRSASEKVPDNYLQGEFIYRNEIYGEPENTNSTRMRIHLLTTA